MSVDGGGDNSQDDNEGQTIMDFYAAHPNLPFWSKRVDKLKKEHKPHLFPMHIILSYLNTMK
jgi:hypothetical protein